MTNRECMKQPLFGTLQDIIPCRMERKTYKTANRIKIEQRKRKSQHNKSFRKEIKQRTLEMY